MTTLAATPHSIVTPSVADTQQMLRKCARKLEEQRNYLAAESAFRAAADSDPRPESRLELAGFLQRTERFEDAAIEYQSLLREAAQKRNSRLMSVAQHNLAAVHRQSGATTTARSLQQNATRSGILYDGELQPEDLTARALDELNAGNPALAESLLQRALACERSRNNPCGMAADYGNLGAVAAVRGEFDTAIRNFAKAYHVHLALDLPQPAGQDLTNLAEVFIQKQRWTLAAKCLRRAMRFFSEAKAHPSLDEAQLRLHEIERVLQVSDRDPLLN